MIILDPNQGGMPADQPPVGDQGGQAPLGDTNPPVGPVEPPAPEPTTPEPTPAPEPPPGPIPGQPGGDQGGQTPAGGVPVV